MVSQKLKYIMKSKGVTNIQVAKHLGMSPQSFSNKLFRDSFSVQDLVAILDFLGCRLIIESEPDILIHLSSDLKS